MSEASVHKTFQRTLPLFNGRDRDVIQRLLHHAVEDLGYDHPDRQLARDIYHEIHEGDAIRLLVGTEIENETLVITPEEIDTNINRILDRFIADMRSESGEWLVIATELNKWYERAASENVIQVAFQYLH